MADEKKVETVAETAAKQTTKAAAKPASEAVKKTAAKKPAAKKSDAKKPAAKKAASKTAAKKAPAKKPAAKKEPVITLDTVTLALWKKFEKANISKIEETIAIQVIVENLGTFFIAVKNGEKHIIQAVYDDRDGTFELSYDEFQKITAGKYDFLDSIKKGTIGYQGDLRKALILKDLFNY